MVGVVSVICALLEDRVRATGRFRVFGVKPESGEGQEVEFDLPIPFGVVCSTLLRENLNKPNHLLVHDSWRFDRNYNMPVVLGVQENEHHLIADILTKK